MGSNNDSREIADQQRADEEARRGRIASTIAGVNHVYDSPARGKQYSDFLKAMREQYGQQLADQYKTNSRNLKFSNARAGLSGGSVDVDSRRTLGEERQKGLIAAENRAQGALGELKSQDEASRMNLIQLAQSGLDAGTAATQAGAMMSANAAAAREGSAGRALGDIFGATAETYKKQQERAAMREGWRAPVGGPYGQTGFGR